MGVFGLDTRSAPVKEDRDSQFSALAIDGIKFGGIGIETLHRRVKFEGAGTPGDLKAQGRDGIGVAWVDRGPGEQPF